MVRLRLRLNLPAWLGSGSGLGLNLHHVASAGGCNSRLVSGPHCAVLQCCSAAVLQECRAAGVQGCRAAAGLHGAAPAVSLIAVRARSEEVGVLGAGGKGGTHVSQPLLEALLGELRVLQPGAGRGELALLAMLRPDADRPLARDLSQQKVEHGHLGTRTCTWAWALPAGVACWHCMRALHAGVAYSGR